MVFDIGMAGPPKAPTQHGDTGKNLSHITVIIWRIRHAQPNVLSPDYRVGVGRPAGAQINRGYDISRLHRASNPRPPAAVLFTPALPVVQFSLPFLDSCGRRGGQLDNQTHRKWTSPRPEFDGENLTVNTTALFS